MSRFAYSLFLLSLFPTVLAGDLIETNSDFDGLPEVVVFDCFPSADKLDDYFEPLNRRVRIPKNFEQSSDDPSWLNWNVRIIEKGESAVFPFASIHFGDLDAGMEWIEREFTILSRDGENGFGVDIYLRTRQPEDLAKDHWLFVIADDKFLKVISRRGIDWNSLLTCFE